MCHIAQMGVLCWVGQGLVLFASLTSVHCLVLLSLLCHRLYLGSSLAVDFQESESQILEYTLLPLLPNFCSSMAAQILVFACRESSWRLGGDSASPCLTLLLALVLLVGMCRHALLIPLGEIISGFHALKHYHLKYQAVTSQTPSPTSQAHKPHLYKTPLASPDR
jgi:hypothetical protein